MSIRLKNVWLWRTRIGEIEANGTDEGASVTTIRVHSPLNFISLLIPYLASNDLPYDWFLEAHFCFKCFLWRLDYIYTQVMYWWFHPTSSRRNRLETFFVATRLRHGHFRREKIKGAKVLTLAKYFHCSSSLVCRVFGEEKFISRIRFRSINYVWFGILMITIARNMFYMLLNQCVWNVSFSL